MPMRTSEAVWEGSRSAGSGSVKLASRQRETGSAIAMTFSSGLEQREGEQGEGTSPEELVAAAHASCFSMALAQALGHAGHPPARVHVKARVLLTRVGAGHEIPKIEIQADAVVPGIDADTFQKLAEEAKNNCPVSRLLDGADIALIAILFETPPRA